MNWLTEFLVEDLDERGEAVGCAGGVADDGLVGVVVVCIHTNDVGRDVALAGGGDEHLLRPCLEVLPGAVPVNENSGPLYHQINPQFPAINPNFNLL